MQVKFPAFRQHELARIEANDAMVALLVGRGLATHTLDLLRGSTVGLPQAFPEVPFVQKLNRSIPEAQDLLSSSERHLAYMSIPFALSVHHQFAKTAARLLSGSGDDGQTVDDARLDLDQIHGFLEELSTTSFDEAEVHQFQFARRLRNRILHFGGTPGTHLRTYYHQEMSDAARAEWERRAGREPMLTPGVPLELGAGELFATLGCAKALADAINTVLQPVLPRAQWADMAVDDWANRPNAKPKPNPIGGIIRYTRRLYGPLELTDAEVLAAFERWRANQKEGSSN